MAATSTQPAPLTPESLRGLLGAARGGFERLPLLRQALERVGPACSEDMEGIVDLPLRLTLVDVVSGIAGDVLPTEPGEVAVGLLAAAQWSTQLIVRADRAAAFAIVEILLGGDGLQPSYKAERPLSGIETGVVGLFFASVARSLVQAFEPVAASTFAVETLGEDIDLEAMDFAAGVLVARYRLEAPEPCGQIVIAIPQTALAALRKSLSEVPKAEAASESDPGWAQHIRKQVTRANVTLTAILDERPGLLAEFFNLEVGQIVGLQATAESRVRIECNGERLLWCELGKANDVYTLRVDAFVDRDQEFMDDILAA
jgi:flagellar motor switch protein FliM